MTFLAKDRILDKQQNFKRMKVFKYILRAIKYFIYISVLLVIILGLLTLFGVVDGNPEVMFRNGYDSLWQIALMFGCVSAFYPMFGYVCKDANAGGQYSELQPILVEFMKSRGYQLVNEEDETLKFVNTSFMKRLSRVFEDQITVKKVFAGFEFEGLRRDVVRLTLGFENRVSRSQDSSVDEQ